MGAVINELNVLWWVFFSFVYCWNWHFWMNLKLELISVMVDFEHPMWCFYVTKSTHSIKWYQFEMQIKTERLQNILQINFSSFSLRFKFSIYCWILEIEFNQIEKLKNLWFWGFLYFFVPCFSSMWNGMKVVSKYFI